MVRRGRNLLPVLVFEFGFEFLWWVLVLEEVVRFVVVAALPLEEGLQLAEEMIVTALLVFVVLVLPVYKWSMVQVVIKDDRHLSVVGDALVQDLNVEGWSYYSSSCWRLLDGRRRLWMRPDGLRRRVLPFLEKALLPPTLILMAV